MREEQKEGVQGEGRVIVECHYLEDVDDEI